MGNRFIEIARDFFSKNVEAFIGRTNKVKITEVKALPLREGIICLSNKVFE